MKKIIISITALFLATFSFSQTQSLSDKTNKPMSAAQRATTELVKIYSLSAEQAREVVKIQASKYEALGKLESMKATDMPKYIAKRLSTFETADNGLMALLDESQLKVFKQQQAEKTTRFDTLVMGMKKQGIKQEDIDKKLADMEF
jgi:hypothetical protein